MDGSIRIRPAERKTLLQIYKTGPTPKVRLRAHVLLLLDQGLPWATITLVLFTSSSTIHRWRRRFLEGGLEAVIGSPGRRETSSWKNFTISLVFHWVTRQTPLDFGFYRSRWACGTVVILLEEQYGVKVGRETVRRWLHQKGLVYRRPRPMLGPQDPQREEKLREIQSLLRRCPPDEIAVFQDEVDINTNPKIGSMWMRRGHQAAVITPGTNTKCYLAGSMNWQTGKIILTEGQRRNADLFVAHLDDLRRTYRRYRVIHVICDNAKFHKPDQCHKLRAWMAQWGHRVKLHYLPTYAPETNPIERVWWHLHEEITRNHRCTHIEELVDLVFEWLYTRKPLQLETSTYANTQAA